MDDNIQAPVTNDPTQVTPATPASVQDDQTVNANAPIVPAEEIKVEEPGVEAPLDEETKESFEESADSPDDPAM